MSKEADEAFEDWWNEINDRNATVELRTIHGQFGHIWQRAWAEKQRRDLAAVETVRDMGSIGWRHACDEIAARIKGGDVEGD